MEQDDLDSTGEDTLTFKPLEHSFGRLYLCKHLYMYYPNRSSEAISPPEHICWNLKKKKKKISSRSDITCGKLKWGNIHV